MLALRCIGDLAASKALSPRAQSVLEAIKLAIGVSGQCDGAPMPDSRAVRVGDRDIGFSLCARHRAQIDGEPSAYFPPASLDSMRSS